MWVEKLAYAWRDRKPTFLTLLLLVCVGVWVWWNGIQSIEGLLHFWDEILGVLFDIATLLFAVMIWHNELDLRWRQSLPKRFDVIFQHNGQPIMRCEYAHLNSEQDIRSLGQQIGVQMLKAHAKNHGRTANDRLEFMAPMVQMENLGAQRNPFDNHSFCSHYRVIFDLQDVPPGVPSDGCLVWSPPFQRVDCEPRPTPRGTSEPALPRSEAEPTP